jgi:16S rRNA (uracil1498-N3)-methyltransferase
MTRRRFIADLVSGNRAALLGAHAAHLSRVLRVRVGEEFDIAVNGHVRHGSVVQVDDQRVEFELGDEIPAGVLLPVTLCLAIIKFERMEWAIEKCTELGAAQVIPLIAARTDVHLAAAAAKRVERWRRLAVQAAEQSRRAASPAIAAPVRLLPGMLPGQGMRIVLNERQGAKPLREALQTPAAVTEGQSPSTLALAVGPEGGWTDGEVQLFAQCGWTGASLGSNILRAETAAIAALAIAIALGCDR